MTGRQRLAGPLLAGLVYGLWAAPAAAASVPVETRIELVVAVPAGKDALPGAALRQQVVDRGIEDAVREVALRYLTAPPEEEPRRESLAELDPLAALGGRARDFVLRYRVLERIGERPAVLLLEQAQPPALEYAARVEVHVDTPRLTDALAALGLWEREPLRAASGVYLIEPPLHWPAWTQLRGALLAAGAGRVVPEDISADGMMIRVDGERGDPASIVARVSADPPQGLEVEGPEPGDPPRLRIRQVPPEERDPTLLD